MRRRLRSFAMAQNGEVLYLLIATIIVASAAIHFNAFEQLRRFVARHEAWQLDEVIILIIFAGLAALILMVRRAQELRREIAKREASEEQANKLARHDALTGLPNRRVFGEDLTAALAVVDDGRAECAVLLIDLDHFKPINDIHGHGAGDAVLIEVSSRISAIVGTSGTVARMGGDEFACVLPYPAASDLPTRLASQILRDLNEPILVQGIRVRVGCTIGIARAPQDGISPGILLHGADLAMYKGKQEGRGTYRFFDEDMDLQLRERATLEIDLRAAVSAGEIIPNFQPVMDLASDTIIGFEALARWMHPTMGAIPPDTFIPIAEDIGIIEDITYAMLRASCLAAREWPASLWLAVNVSPLQLKDPWLASRLLAIMTETGLAPGRLVIEVTENAVIDDTMKAQEIFLSLQNAGVRLSLDDFGKGYSSLYHLRKLHFDELKIDRSFVHSMDSAESAKIVSAVTALGKSLGMPVTAEGVETAAEAEALRALGCEHAQGFLFGKPLDAAGTIALLRQIGRDDSSHRRSA